MATSENPKIKNPRKAVELAERVCAATDYKEPESLDTLAAAYAAEGNFNKAIETAEKAIELCTSPAHNVLKSEIGKRLELYKAGTSFIETH
jgi:tetratricopeptide (TPR) repeat protein